RHTRSKRDWSSDVCSSDLPAGEPNFILGMGTTSTTLALWKFHVDWTTPANSTFTGPTTITVSSFAEACTGGTCIPQPGTSQKLEIGRASCRERVESRGVGS